MVHTYLGDIWKKNEERTWAIGKKRESLWRVIVVSRGCNSNYVGYPVPDLRGQPHTCVRITYTPFPRSPATFLPRFATPFTYELNYYAPYGSCSNPALFRLFLPTCSPGSIVHQLLSVIHHSQLRSIPFSALFN